MDSTPEFLDFTVTTPEKWEEAKRMMTVSDDRIPWDYLKKNYDKWVAEGRWITADFWFGDDKDAIVEEIRRVIPVLKQNGGYIFSSDHSIPNSVSLENFKAIVEEVKRVGQY